MVGCTRIIKLIVMTLGIYLIVINVVLWANDPKINLMLLNSGNGYHYENMMNFVEYHNTKMINYRGFQWFFDRLSTFPGLQNTVQSITTYQKLISTLPLGKMIFISVLEAVVNGLVTPFRLLCAFIVDIFNNLVWFFGFIWQL